jgi:hypothetical protein
MTGMSHSIDTEDATPTHQPPYRAGPDARKIMEEEIERMLRLHVIQPSVSTWASPVVPVSKADGSTRFCVDYRKLNDLTVRDSFPLPRFGDTLDSIGAETIFTKLDARAGFWQVPVDPKNRSKTAFATHRGLYDFLRMPFGLTNASSTFQRNIDLILSRVKLKTALVYLDDIIIFSASFEQHLQDVEDVLAILRSGHVQLRADKSQWFQQEIHFLGYDISPGRMRILHVKSRAIADTKIALSQSAVRTFLGFPVVYCRYVNQFAVMLLQCLICLRRSIPVTLLPSRIRRSLPSAVYKRLYKRPRCSHFRGTVGRMQSFSCDATRLRVN